MKYTINGFDQQALCLFSINIENKSYSLDIIDTFLLRWILNVWSNKNFKRTINTENNKEYMYLKYDAMIEEFPFLNLNKRKLWSHLKKLIDFCLVEHFTLKKEGTWSYYRPNLELIELIDHSNITIDSKIQNENLEKIKIILAALYKNVYPYTKNCIRVYEKLYKGYTKNCITNYPNTINPKTNIPLFNKLNKVTDFDKSDSNISIELIESNNSNQSNIIKKIKDKIEISNFTKRCTQHHFEKVLLKSPNIKKEKYFNDKELIKVQEYLLLLFNGISKTKYNALYNWGIDSKNKDIIDIINNGLKDNMKILELLKKACLVYTKDFYPDNKNYLPNRLSEFIYSPAAKIKSKLLYYAFNLKKLEIEVKKKQDLNSEITKKYIDWLGFELNNKSYNRLVDIVQNIKSEFANINVVTKDINGKQYFRQQIETSGVYGTLCGNIDNFIAVHIQYLESRGVKQKHVGMIATDNGWWQNFINWMNVEHDIVLYRTKKEYDKMTQKLMKTRIAENRY